MAAETTHKSCCDKGVFQRILVGVDDSEPGRWAVLMAAKIAQSSGAAMAMVHVIPSEVALTPEFTVMRPDLAEERRIAATALLERIAKTANLPKPELLVREGEAAPQIIAAAKEWQADVIVVGTHGRGTVAHLLLGSTAESVVRHAHSPVLTVGCDPAVMHAERSAKATTTSAKCCGGNGHKKSIPAEPALARR